ncbi:sensor histidine kinase [Bacillus cereus]|uniref:sensor histidine kinase n=1 Tax=Bacillus cereus TaxID=1396 RepID=UPI003B75EB60
MKRKNIYISMIIITYFSFFLYIGVKIIFNPYIGVEVKREGATLTITDVYKNSWGSEYLKVNDKIIEVFPYYDESSGNLEGAKKIKVIKNHKIIEYEVNYNHLFSQLFYHLIIPLIFIGVCLIYCFVLYRDKNFNELHRNIIFICLMLSIGYFSAGASARGDILSREITGLCFNIIPVLLAHNLYYTFSYLFIKKHIYKFFYFAYVLSFIICITDLFGHSVDISKVTTVIRLVFFSLSNLLLFIFIIKIYFQVKEKKDGPVLRIFLCGLCISFLPIFILYVIPKILFDKCIVPADTAASSLIILPTTLFYLTKKEIYFDVDYLLKKIKQYSLFALFPSVIIVMLSTNIENELSYLFLFIICLLICFNIIFFLRDNLEEKFKKHFTHQNSLYNFIKKTSYIYSLEDLVDCMNQEIQEVFNGVEVTSFKLSMKTKMCCSEVALNCSHVDLLFQKLQNKRNDIYELNNVINVENQVYLVLGENKSIYTILHLTEKLNSIQFNPEEKKWIEMLMYYACIVFENLKKIDVLLLEIKQLEKDTSKYPYWVSRLFCTISEKEHMKLANEIHDNILQDQLLIYREFEQITTTLKDGHEIPIKKIDVLKENLLDNIYLIRETCNNLRPAFLQEIGINEALKNLIQKIQLHANFEVIYYFDELQNFSNEVTINVYRIIQELLNNAIKHSYATKVIITLQIKDGKCILNYKDNGVGFNSRYTENTSSIGLFSIKERVHAMKGDITFTSVPSEGLSVNISFVETNIW